MRPYLKEQIWPKDELQKEQMTQKILKTIKRGYVSQGAVTSLTGFFLVPKGELNIRMVYDATKCGLNETIWAPSFWLPTINTTLAQVEIGGYMTDINLGEMFLNFPLDNKLWKWAGIDVTEIQERIDTP